MDTRPGIGGLSDYYFYSGRPWIDPNAYGADPTGDEDSTAAINEALQDASGAGQVFIPPGSYVVAGTILLPSNTMLVMSPQSTFIQVSGTGTVMQNQHNTVGGSGDTDIQVFGGTFVLASGATGSVHMNFGQITGLRLSGMTLSGANSGTAEAIVVNNIYQAMIDHVSVNVYDSAGNSSCNGIWVRGGNSITVSDCVVQSGDDAYAFSSVNLPGADDLHGVSISNCYGDSRRGRVLDIETGVNSVYQVVATGISGRANSGAGGDDSACIAIRSDNLITNGCYDVSVSNCVIDSSAAQYGVQVDGAYNVNVSNIVLSGAVSDYCFGATTTASTSTLTQNVRFSNCVGTSSSATFGALCVLPATGGTVSGIFFSNCNVTGSGGLGANIDGANAAISDISVTGCYIVGPGTTGTGVSAHGTITRSDVSFNHLPGWATQVDNAAGSGVTVQGTI